MNLSMCHPHGGIFFTENNYLHKTTRNSMNLPIHTFVVLIFIYWNDFVSCGNDFLTCGNDFLSCFNDFPTCGNKLVSCDNDFANLWERASILW